MWHMFAQTRIQNTRTNEKLRALYCLLSTRYRDELSIHIQDITQAFPSLHYPRVYHCFMWILKKLNIITCPITPSMAIRCSQRTNRGNTLLPRSRKTVLQIHATHHQHRQQLHTCFGRKCPGIFFPRYVYRCSTDVKQSTVRDPLGNKKCQQKLVVE